MLLRSIHEFRSHVAGLVALGVLLQEVGEEEHLEDGKHDEKFDEDDGPQRLAEAHVAETVVVQVEGPIQKTVFVHRRSKITLQIYGLFLKVPNDLLKFVLFFGKYLKNKDVQGSK